MQDTEYKRLIDLAKDRAFFGFMALVQRAMQDTEHKLARKMTEATSNLDRTALNALRHFLRQDSNVFLRRIDTLYRNALDRAMRTMYVDMRPGMRNMSADELTLIDDEVVHHQIEVGRLAERMREENEESIGRLNVIVAQMHGEREARERENPFRPYLLARVLYDASREVVADEPKTKLLFEHLSNALIQHLPGYYGAIREVFESSGMQGKFVTLPGRSTPHQRYFGAPSGMPDMPARFEAVVAPGLQRLLDTMQQAGHSRALPWESGEVATAHDTIRKMLGSSRALTARAGAAGPDATQQMPATSLVAQLDQFQKSAAAGQPIDDETQAEGNQLFAVREKLDLGTASMMERMTLEVVAMLFEFILDDRQIPASVRQYMARLQIPFLKAAMLEPALLHEENHPARELLNRISSAAGASDSDSDDGRKLDAEIDRITARILAEFDSDVSLFASSLGEFEKFLNDHLRCHDREIGRAIDAVEVAEKISMLLTNLTSTLCDMLLPLNVDKRISDFIIHVWPHVLVSAAWNDLENGQAADAPDSLFRQYRAVLPELLWSIQEKQGANERSALIRLLPDLVKRMNKALKLIQLPNDECKAILDLLMALHTQVLRTGSKGGAKTCLALEELQHDFVRLTINWERISWELSEPPRVRADLVEEVFARRAIGAELHLDAESAAVSSAADREFLAQTYLLGTRVEFRADGSEPVPAQLVWISAHRSLYLFRCERSAGLVLYTVESLLDVLGRGMLLPVEYAPVFERAVESLLFSAEKLNPA